MTRWLMHPRNHLPLLGLCALLALATAIVLSPKPGPASAAGSVTAIAAGQFHTCALTTAGGVLCWGDNFSGQIGSGRTFGHNTTPVAVAGLESGVASISAGGGNTCALTTKGAVQCWGNNSFGQIGDGTAGSRNDRASPVGVLGLGSGVTAIAVGGDHTCALTNGNRVKCWGSSALGTLGDDQPCRSICATPIDVAGLETGVMGLAAGAGYTCALTMAGSVKCWGRNFGAEPVEVLGPDAGVVAIDAGESHACAASSNGRLTCWGTNSSGQLGDGQNCGRTCRTPVDVCADSLCDAALAGVADFAVGAAHTCAVVATGGVKCWGWDNQGQLSDMDNIRTTPVDMLGLGKETVALAAGFSHTCAVSSAAGVKCWGSNFRGQLGDGQSCGMFCSAPVEVTGLGPALPSTGTGAGISSQAGSVQRWLIATLAAVGTAALSYGVLRLRSRYR